MKKLLREKNIISIKILLSYLGIILGPAIGILFIYFNMQTALYKIQEEKIQGTNKEISIFLDNEFQEAINVSRYIAEKSGFNEYYNNLDNNKEENDFFGTIKISKKSPDYALFVKLIKKVNIVIEDYPYIISYPQIIPNTNLGRETIPFLSGNNYKNLLSEAKNIKLDGVIEFKGHNKTYILAIRHIGLENGKKGLVVLELDKKHIKDLLNKVKGNINNGLAFLVDNSGNIIESSNNLYNSKKINNTLDVIEKKNGRLYEVSNFIRTNNWSILTVLPKDQLAIEIAGKRNTVLVICFLSILVGLIFSIERWNKTRPLVQRYLMYKENKKVTKPKDIWNGLINLIKDAKDLEQEIRERNKWATEQILKKIFYDMYDSEEEIIKDLKRTKLDNKLVFPAFIFSIDFDINAIINMEMWDNIEREIISFLDLNLKSSYEIVHIDIENWTVIVFDNSNLNEIESLMDKLSQWIIHTYEMNFYLACSEKVTEISKLTDEYDNLIRIKEYEKYYKIRGPLWIKDLPKHKYINFTVDLELQLEKTIKNGSEGQINEIISQIKETYFNSETSIRVMKRYNFEIIRRVILRCFKTEKSMERDKIVKITQEAKTQKQMEEIIYLSWDYFSRKKVTTVDKREEEFKEEVLRICNKNYNDNSFNLSKLAEEVLMDEKKLYREFKKIFGQSFSSYIEILRISKAKELLKDGMLINDIANSVGYSSDYSFRRAFKRVVGMTPSEYQQLQKFL